MNSPFIFGTDEMLFIVASDYPLFRFVKIFGLKAMTLIDTLPIQGTAVFVFFLISTTCR